MALAALAIVGLVLGLVFGLSGDDSDDDGGLAGGSGLSTSSAGSAGSGEGSASAPGGGCEALVARLSAQLGSSAQLSSSDASIPSGAPTPEGSPARVCEVTLDSFGSESIHASGVILAEFPDTDAADFRSEISDEGWRSVGGIRAKGSLTMTIHMRSGGSNVLSVISDGENAYIVYITGSDIDMPSGMPSVPAPSLPGIPTPTVSVPMPTFPGGD